VSLAAMVILFVLQILCRARDSNLHFLQSFIIFILLCTKTMTS
jgi:hypothetical protein